MHTFFILIVHAHHFLPLFLSLSVSIFFFSTLGRFAIYELSSIRVFPRHAFTHTHTHTHRDTHGKHTNFSPSHAFRVCICMYVYVFMYVSLFCCLFLVCYSYYINRSRSIMKKCSVPLPYDYSNSAKANNLLSTTIDANNFEIKKETMHKMIFL